MASVCIKKSLSYVKYIKFRRILKLNCIFSTGFDVRSHSTSQIGSITDEDGSTQRGQYRGHRPTTPLQKTLLTLGSAAMAILHPDRGDMIATLGDVTAETALKRIKQKMESDPIGQQILRDQPVISTSTISIDYLGSLGDNTFGKEYWRFLTKHGFSPDARLPVHYVDDPELVYVMLRYRQCHDLFHTVLGMRPNMLGECVVKWVEAIQLGLPMCAMGALVGPIRLLPKHRQNYVTTYLPWALRNGQNGKFLMNVYFEREWERDLAEMREELGLEPPPEEPYPR